MTATDARTELRRLTAERLDAVEAGLGGNDHYMSQLDQEVAAARAAFVGLALTEIATFRAQLGGPQRG